MDMLAKQMNQVDMASVFDTLLHRGITKYRKTSSKAPFPRKVEEDKLDQFSKKGGVFVVRQKEDFTDQGVKGYIVTSKETLLEDMHQLSHFTPNVYRKYTYKDEARRYITGFEERNLLQVNAFVVDIDTKKYSREDILMACLEDSIGIPTLIVSTTRGYQVYFALTAPLFISNKNDFRGLRVAKRIADNLKRSLKSVEADPYCNDFGFFRVPKPSNLVHVQLEQTYTVADLIDWSMRQDDDIQRPLFVVHTNTGKKADITRTEWFQALIEAVDVKGKKGQLGRNNMLFTLALVCFQEGWSKERTMDFLDEYNIRLRYPLSGAALYTILESAYSGKYNGPAKEYVEELLAIYVPNKAFDVKLGGKGWYKFKKAREDRQNSHFDEWEKDLVEYLTAEFNQAEPFIWRTQKQICEAIGIPQSSLNELIKKSTRILKTVTGKGRSSKTGWTTVSLFMKHVLFELQQTKLAYQRYLQMIMEEQLVDVIESPAAEKVMGLVNRLKDTAPPSYLQQQLDNSG
mgnify:FL=1